jgi:hypothetical protein
MSNLIGSVTWTPPKPAAGDSVRIDVRDPAGTPYGNQQSPYIGINGVPGSTQFLQFALAGDYKVSVAAMGADGTKEQNTVTITVAAPALSAATQAALADPANGNLPQEQLAYLKATSDVNLLTVTPKAPYATPHEVSFNLFPLIKFLKPPVPPPAATAALKAAAPSVSIAATAGGANASTSWTWDFGDGSAKVSTSSPAADHDYTSSLGSTNEFHQFHVNLTEVQNTNGGTPAVPGGSWTRTLSVHNPYVSIKKRGYVVLPVTANGSATKDGESFVGTAEIKNIEPVPITLCSRLLVPVLEDTSVLTAPTPLEALADPIIVPANGSITVKVSAPFSQVPENSFGFKVIFTDETVKGANSSTPQAAQATAKSPIDGLKVRATAHFQVQPEYRGKAVLETAKNDPKAASGPAPDPVPNDEVMPPVREGNQCDPDNLPSDAPATLACQITPKTEKVLINAQFLNAAKGDVILCPSVGSASLVDAMFSQLTPPQLYGHSGIMTRNYEQITHCTASESRLINYTVSGILGGGDEGFDPDALKYAWPGALTQTIDHCINGEMITDPSSSTNQQYKFQDFLGTSSDIQLANVWTLIPPVVVKPDPVLETTAVRKLLSDVADDAYSSTGKYHYRFYCFTDPASTALKAPASGLSASSTWAENSNGAVCSSFIWKSMKGGGVEAMGPSKFVTASELGDSAKSLGVFLDPDGQTLDGLFYYPADERKVCASWLHDTVWNMADAQAGWAGELLTHAADYYADELCSSFAVDDSTTEDSDISWENPSGANAISPNDYLAWVGPDKGGVLGYSEPLIYMPANYATVNIYEWAKVTAYGQLTGKVTLDGAAAPDVTLTVPGYSVGTDKDGNYTFDKIPYGPYDVIARQADTKGPFSSGVQTGTAFYNTGRASITLDKNSVTAPEIKLKKANTPYIRTILVTGHVSLDCSVWDWGSNHYDYYGPIAQGSIDVGNGHPQDSWSTTTSVHSASVVFSATFNYQPDDSVNVFFKAVLDGSGERDYTATIAPGDNYTFVIGNSQSFLNGRAGYTYNGYPDLEASNDTMCCAITFANNEWSA